MHYARISALAVPLSAAEQEQVHQAAEMAGQDTEDFMRDALVRAADAILGTDADPFDAALEQAAKTIAGRATHDRMQHDYAG